MFSLETPLPVTPFKAVNGESQNQPGTPMEFSSPMGPLIIDETSTKPNVSENRSESPETDIESIPNEIQVI